MYSLRFILCFILLSIILVACNTKMFVQPEKVVIHTYKNPHILCNQCHTTEDPQSGTALFAPGTDPSSLCLDCHEYKENHHPVNFVPDDPSNFPMPLFKDEVRCLTCHEMQCGPGREVTPKLLRGGPYSDRRGSCFICHSREMYARINPHNMLDITGNIRKIKDKPVCFICHSIQPNPEVDGTNDVRFRADIGFLCWRCHPPMPGDFFEKHFLIKPSAETLQTMLNTEETNLVILPIVPRGRVTCSTCHNPHQEGVIKRTAPAKGADSRHKLRMQSTCIGCHRSF
jgi:nitrate/TMAO reductase-like tetraheme cytochrome c subunit